MVREEIVFGQKVSAKGITIDKSKIEAIQKLWHPQDVKSLKNFLVHASFYRRFIKDFAKLAEPLSALLEKDALYVFNSECVDAFEKLRIKLISSPILQPLDWDKPFEIMCDASYYALGAVLGQRDDEKKLINIH